MKKIVLMFLAVGLCQCLLAQTYQTVVGQAPHPTKMDFYEYYNHAPSEWVRLFTIKNYNPEAGFWGKGGVSGRAYFVDYQGNGAGYVDFSFPQALNGNSKPVIQVVGDAARRFKWAAKLENPGPGQERYAVYLYTPPYHLGFSFLMRGADYWPDFNVPSTPPTGFDWSSDSNLESFSMIDNQGNHGIGTLNPKERLSVNGKIRAQEVKVVTTGWPDYVFEPGYDFGKLEELERYVRQYRHLPEIPSAKEVESNGVSLGEMNRLLLKKVEELTLHLIEQNRVNVRQEQRIDSLERQLQSKK